MRLPWVLGSEIGMEVKIERLAGAKKHSRFAAVPSKVCYIFDCAISLII
jgi:hypothetical protein